MVAPIITFLSLPFILRLYNPAEYGLWLLLLSLVVVPGNVSTLRYDLAIVLAKNEHDAGRLFALCCWLILGFGIIAAAFIYFAPLWQNIFPALENAGSFLWFIPLLILMTGISWTATATCTRRKAFGVKSASLVVLAVTTNGFQLLAPTWGIDGSPGLILGSFMGYLTSMLVLMVGVFRFTPPEFLGGMGHLSYGDLIKRYQYFPRFSVPYSIAGTLRAEGVKLLFGAYGSSALVGDFSFAHRLTNFPVTLFGGSIRPVYFQRASQVENLRTLLPMTRALLMGLSLLIIPGAVAFEFHAEEIMAFLGGEKWVGSADYARILVMPSVVLMHVGWLDRIFDVKERQRLALYLQAGFSLFGLLVLGLGLFLFSNPLLAIWAQSIVLMGYYAILLVVVFRIAGFGIKPVREILAFPMALVILVLGFRFLAMMFLGPRPSMILGVLAAWVPGAVYYFWRIRGLQERQQ